MEIAYCFNCNEMHYAIGIKSFLTTPEDIEEAGGIACFFSG
ncbi:MAG: hypothetical protein PHD40_08105 [Syntrophomonadaceae bacterium]|nr:hypothetical protein [Syntrophomonadaceae bacterium]